MKLKEKKSLKDVILYYMPNFTFSLIILFSLWITLLIPCDLCEAGSLTKIGGLILESCQVVQLLLVLLCGLTTCRQVLFWTQEFFIVWFIHVTSVRGRGSTELIINCHYHYHYHHCNWWSLSYDIWNTCQDLETLDILYILKVIDHHPYLHRSWKYWECSYFLDFGHCRCLELCQMIRIG